MIQILKKTHFSVNYNNEGNIYNVDCPDLSYSFSKTKRGKYQFKDEDAISTFCAVLDYDPTIGDKKSDGREMINELRVITKQKFIKFC